MQSNKDRFGVYIRFVGTSSSIIYASTLEKYFFPTQISYCSSAKLENVITGALEVVTQ